MKKIKKFMLLERAMRDYPAGTVARFKSAPHVEHISDGTFKIMENTGNGTVVISHSDMHCFYCSEPEEWATPDNLSILSGKCAIQVNNEREFKLLMEHYESKGWKWEDGGKCYPIDKLTDNQLKAVNYKTSVMYINNFLFNPTDKDWNIIPFADFAKEVGIKVPVFVMKSEDGEGLYEGDKFLHVRNTSLGWDLNTSILPDYKFTCNIYKSHLVFSDPERNKAFSTKAAAEAWIKEQNKPKVIRLNFEGGEAIITKDKISVHLDKENGKGYFMDAGEIEPIYKAYKSLQ